MKNNKGFTLIELMIVIAIIAIIAAIAIPNLMASRVRANEATAIAAIKQISTAQVTFQAGRQGRSGSTVTNGGNNGYCDNYRNLAFAPPVGGTLNTHKLALVSDVVANAALLPNGGGATTTLGNVSIGVVANGGENYQGYYFDGDPDVNYKSDFACYAYPSMSGTTGNNAYWVGQQGTVYIEGLVPTPTATAIGTALYATGETPQKVPVPAGWTTL